MHITKLYIIHIIVIIPECPGCGVGGSNNVWNCSYHCGFIASPNYPYLYPHNTVVTWKIRIHQDNYIRMEFTEFHVESSLPDCAQDYVKIYNILRNGSMSLLGTYCEANPPPPVLLSGMNEMTVVLTSDAQHSNAGFFGHYSSERFTLKENIKAKISTAGIEVYFNLCCAIM